MKLGIVGCGNVGSCSAYACMMRGVGTEIVLVDKNPDLATAQAEDILHATPFATSMPVSSGGYEALEGAGIVMIAAGANQKDGETRLDLLKRNAAILHDMIPAIVAAAPDAFLLLASNPVDIMTHMTARIAQGLGVSPRKVIGSGTILDTARFRTLLARHLGVSSHSVHAHVIGEHGDSEVLHWSGASVSNLSLCDFAAQARAPVTDGVRRDIDEGVRRAAYRIIKGKGATWYGIGAGMARLADVIIRDEHAILTCSSLQERVEGVEDVTLSLPHVLSARGIERVLYPAMDDTERAGLERSAGIIKSALTGVDF